MNKHEIVTRVTSTPMCPFLHLRSDGTSLTGCECLVQRSDVDEMMLDLVPLLNGRFVRSYMQVAIHLDRVA